MSEEGKRKRIVLEVFKNAGCLLLSLAIIFGFIFIFIKPTGNLLYDIGLYIGAFLALLLVLVLIPDWFKKWRAKRKNDQSKP